MQHNKHNLCNKYKNQFKTAALSTKYKKINPNLIMTL